ncbi:MAG: PaaI family thioesterase, partial [Pseudomonadota bacterium]
MTGRLEFPIRIPFVERLGLELWRFGGGEAELRVDLAEAHLNSWAVAHGGVLMTLLDVAMAHA